MSKFFLIKELNRLIFFFDKSYFTPINFENSKLAYDVIESRLKKYRFYNIKPNNKYFYQIKKINNNIKKIINSV